MLKDRSRNDFERHVEEVRERSTQIKTGDKGYQLSDLDTRKNELIRELKNIKYIDVKDMVYRMELTYDEIPDILNVKYFAASTAGYTSPPIMYRISDITSVIKSLLPKGVKVDITTDDIKFKSNLSTNKTIRYTKNSFFYVIVGFTLSHLGPLSDFKGFIQMTPGIYKSDKPINFTGIDKILLKCYCIQGSTVNGIREPFSIALLLINHQVISFLKNQGLNILKR